MTVKTHAIEILIVEDSDEYGRSIAGKLLCAVATSLQDVIRRGPIWRFVAEGRIF